MANSLSDGDIQLLAEKISQVVSDAIEPLTSDDCFITGVDSQDPCSVTSYQYHR